MADLLPLYYRDEWIVLAGKPAGLLVHRSDNASDRVFMLQLLRNQLGQKVYPVHRLDRATSGVMIYALDSQTAASLVEAFTAGEIRKIYVAVVRGWVEEDMTVDYALREHRQAPPQDAVTCFRPLAKVEMEYPVKPFHTARYSLLECRPQTGRMHQIRRHLSHLSHPIINDTTYGDSRHNRFFRDMLQTRRMLLHAKSIEFMHPIDGQMLRVEASLPDDMRRALCLLGWA